MNNSWWKHKSGHPWHRQMLSGRCHQTLKPLCGVLRRVVWRWIFTLVAFWVVVPWPSTGGLASRWPIQLGNHHLMSLFQAIFGEISSYFTRWWVFRRRRFFAIQFPKLLFNLSPLKRSGPKHSNWRCAKMRCVWVLRCIWCKVHGVYPEATTGINKRLRSRIVVGNAAEKAGQIGQAVCLCGRCGLINQFFWQKTWNVEPCPNVTFPVHLKSFPTRQLKWDPGESRVLHWEVPVPWTLKNDGNVTRLTWLDSCIPNGDRF